MNGRHWCLSLAKIETFLLSPGASVRFAVTTQAHEGIEIWYAGGLLFNTSGLSDE